MQDKYCVDCYNIYSIQSHYKENHKRGGAAFGRATSFVVAANGRHLCSVMNRVDVVDLDVDLVDVDLDVDLVDVDLDVVPFC